MVQRKRNILHKFRFVFDYNAILCLKNNLDHLLQIWEYSNHSSGKLDTNKVADEGFKLSASEVEHFSQSSGKFDSTDFAPFDSLETHVDAKPTRQYGKDLILTKQKELAQKRKDQDASLMDNVEDSTLTKERHFEERRMKTVPVLHFIVNPL